MALPALVKAAAWSANVAEFEPAATVTEAGTVSELLLDVSSTDTPPAGALALSVTVQPLVPEGATTLGLQVSEEISIVVVTSVMDALAVLPL